MSNDFEIDVDRYIEAFSNRKLRLDMGKITRVVGNVITGYIPGVRLGSICLVYPSGGEEPFKVEVVGFKDREVIMMPLNKMSGVGHGAKLVLVQSRSNIFLSENMLGRVIDGLCVPIDGKGPIETSDEISLYREVETPLKRDLIREPIDLGIRSINGLLTVGRGQRVGIMAGSGVGKSVLLGMIARNTDADVNVIALIGERGREVREFIENDLGKEGLSRSVVVVATSEQSPLMRMRGAFVATSIAEYFSKMGKNVLFLMDSVTRFAMAQREIGLSIGEPPASKGYTPSVFSLLPKLVERVGYFEGCGSVTGLYSVLVEGDDMDDPIGDSVRSLLDGHIVLDRKLAQRGHYPAVDVLQSSSRVMRHVTDEEHQLLAYKLKEIMSIYRDAEDLINIGAYKVGSNPKIDESIRLMPKINEFLKQKIEDCLTINTIVEDLKSALT